MVFQKWIIDLINMKIKRFNESAEYGEDFIRETFLWFEDNFKTDYNLDITNEINKSIYISFNIEDITEYEEIMSEYLKSLNLLMRVYKVHNQNINFDDETINFKIEFSIKVTLEEFKKRFLNINSKKDVNYIWYYFNEKREFNVNQPSVSFYENYFKITIHKDQIKSFDEKYPNEEERFEQYEDATRTLHVYSYRYSQNTLDMILGIIEGKF